MVKLNSIVRLLNKELKIKKIKDQSKNGLQVRASENISKVGLATDACMDAFKKAKKLGCNLVIVHHGLFWKKQKDTAGLIKKKVRFLKKNKISLYAAHLPLDKHKKYGNNANLFILLDAKPKKLFRGVGYIGDLKKASNVNSIKKELEKKLKAKCMVWSFGKKKIKKIAIVSGYGGGGDIPEAVKKSADLFITGEVSHGSYHRAKEGRINVIAAGHYKTETIGVKTLGELLKEKFNLKTVFIYSPTGM
ncbi:MAG: Nif3-like dinuclear metal center hexameric protein [Candidatus Aenigmarchaeota archaeon]|nr:Nif3-like dinuclear metal center hexameric protein [Candidatus Aenigmarchaeota archaeon]